MSQASKRLQELLKAMTIKEKVAQLVQLVPDFFLGDEISEDNLTGPLGTFRLQPEHLWSIGSVINCQDAAMMCQIQEKFLKQNRLGIPLIFMNDVVHGFKTTFPVPLALAGSFDMDLIKRCAGAMAVEAAASGTHVTFAPMLDLSRDPRWGRVVESPGEDPFLGAKAAEAWVQGFQGDSPEELKNGERLASCVKHFAGYGLCEGGRDYNTTDLSELFLRQYYLPAFQSAVDAGCKMVMSAFTTFNGIPITGNRYLLRNILRNDMGFEGSVISDWAAIKELYVNSAAQDERDTVRRTMAAGVDIDMMSEYYLKYLEELSAETDVMSQIDEAVLRVLQLKEDIGLFDDPFRGVSPQKEAQAHLCDAHRKLALEAAEKSIVLLKNNGILPLRPGIKSVAVIGPYACSPKLHGPWCALHPPEDCKTIADELRKVLPEAHITAIPCDMADISQQTLEDAARAAAQHEVVILALGETAEMGGEDGGRSDISLPDAQRRLVECAVQANPHTILVLIHNRPLVLRDESEKVAAVLAAWFPGTEGGTAVANVVCGKYNPSARLAMSFPWSQGQIPVYYSRFGTGRPNASGDSAGRFCVRYIDAPLQPAYPFGYGLSYARWEYSGLTLSNDHMPENGEIIATVTVENTGDYDGIETVQLYLRDMAGSVIRPLLELKAFQQIAIPAGEKREVSFSITPDMLAYYTDDLSYQAEPGEFYVFAGHDSSALLQQPFYYGTK